MLRFLTNHVYPIGVDAGDDALTLAQMAKDINGIRLLAADRIECPGDMRPGSIAWQEWAVEAIAESVTEGRFQGRKVIAAQSAGDVFVETIKMPQLAEDELQHAIINRILPTLKIDPDNLLIRHVRSNSKNIFVMASDRAKLLRHMAMYEKARLKVEAISVWPMAALGAYASLWARHVGQDDPVALLDIGRKSTRIVICDSVNLYFAHPSSVGATDLESDRMVDLLGSEMDSCRVKFKSTYKESRVDHIIFVSGHSVDKNIYTAIARRAQMSAQIGDCLDAVRIRQPELADLRNHAPHANWITAMGLSLPQIESPHRCSQSRSKQAC